MWRSVLIAAETADGHNRRNVVFCCIHLNEWMRQPLSICPIEPQPLQLATVPQEPACVRALHRLTIDLNSWLILLVKAADHKGLPAAGTL